MIDTNEDSASSHKFPYGADRTLRFLRMTNPSLKPDCFAIDEPASYILS